jgi:uncharacterized protein
MSKIIKVSLVILTLSFLSAACSRATTNSPMANPSNNSQTPTTYDTPLQVGTQTIMVEVRDNDDERRLGLSGRPPLKDDQGMLFDFRDSKITTPGFWMKDMKFDIDIIWIKNGRIIGITKNAQRPLSNQDNLPRYYPPSEIDMVLEVLAGWSNRHNIKVGDQVKFVD